MRIAIVPIIPFVGFCLGFRSAAGLVGFALATVALAKVDEKGILFKFLVDPSVIGGVITQVGDTIIDGTVRRRLNQLKEAI